MHTRRSALVFWFATLLAAPPALAELPVFRSGDLSLDLGGMGQLLAGGQYVPDAFKDPEEAYLYLKEARLRLGAGWRDYTVHVELAMGGEAGVAAPSPGVTLELLDFYANVPIHLLGQSFVRVGQFKVPYGREQLTYSEDLSFADRSINQPAFVVGRDVGATFNLRLRRFTVIAGIFTGGGRDVPAEYLPEKLGIPLFALRAGIGNLDDDPYYLSQDEPELDKLRAALFVSGLYTKDTLIGHSSVLNVKLADKSLLLNSGWNPFIALAPLDQGQWFQVGLDGALRAPIGSIARRRVRIAAELEGNYASYVNAYGRLQLWGGRAQVGVGLGGFELAVRYAFLLPDARLASTPSTGAPIPITGSDPIHEITPAVSYRFFGDHFKVILDAPILVDVPVFTEPNVGVYVATQMPNQASVLTKGGSVARLDVEGVRLLLQARF